MSTHRSAGLGVLAAVAVASLAVAHDASAAERHRRAPVPEQVGGGQLWPDYIAAAQSGTIVAATGMFLDMNASSSATAYSLQMNTPPFATAMCNAALPGTTKPCEGWQQFVYEGDGPTQSDVNMQYWLLHYAPASTIYDPCPIGWTMFQFNAQSDIYCYTDGSSTNPSVTYVRPDSLKGVQMHVTAGQNGADDTLTVTQYGVTLGATHAPSPLGLAGNWTSVEFNTFGLDDSLQVQYAAPSSALVEIDITPSNGSTEYAGVVANSYTGESNNFNTPFACEFGGPTPGIQFFEGIGVTPPPDTCPALTLVAPAPVAGSYGPSLPIPQGASVGATGAVTGSLIDHSSASLVPRYCQVTNVTAPFTATVTNGGGGVGPGITFSVPSSAPPGTAGVATITCDTVPGSIEQALTVVDGWFYANPPRIEVLTNSCSMYEGDNYATFVSTYDPLPYTIVSPVPAPPGLSLTWQWGTLAVCDSSGQPGSYEVEVTANGEVAETAWLNVAVASCIPATGCGQSCSSTTPDGCGGILDCSKPGCTGGTTCQSGLLCCPPGQSIPAGGTTCQCPSGSNWNGSSCVTCAPGTTWNASYEQCVTPCKYPYFWCPAANACLTVTACKHAGG